MGFRELALLLLLFLAVCSAQSTYYVTPTPDTPCPGEPCYSLSEYISGEAGLPDSDDLTFLFLPGDHILDSGGPIDFGQLTILNLFGDSASFPEVTSTIVCSQPTSFNFSQINRFNISGIAFKLCGSIYDPPIILEQTFQAEISNCLFQGGKNGALAVVGSNLTLLENRLENNSGARGAVYINRSVIHISGNIFVDNHADENGGGVYMTDSTANVCGNIFMNNSVGQWGGGLYAENSTVKLNSNIFRNNTAVYGGGIEVYRNSFVGATNNTFARNFASIAGGGIDIDSEVVATFVDNVFEYNAAQSGGGFSVTGNGSTVSFTQDSFISNIATSAYGGGVYMKNSTANMSGNMFINNSASEWGGGVFLENCTVNFNSNLFMNNTARYGGGIEAYNDSSVSATNNNFIRNVAGIDGGGIDIFFSVVANFMGNIFESNKAQNEGGGGVSVFGGSTVSFTLDSFISNTAENGSGIFIIDSIMSITESHLADNSATQDGVFAIDSSHINTSGRSFTNNAATSAYGGGVYMKSSTALNVSENKFINNSASGWGGGVYLENSTVNFNNNLFVNNTASFGGGIEVYSDSNVRAINNNFTRNTAGIGGGGIEIYNGAAANFMGNILEYNKANEGGGVSVYLNSNASFTLDSFISNTADETGGGILVTDSFINITESNLTSNSAGNRGGGSYLVSGTAYFRENMFVNNSASLNGAGIYSASDTNSIECTNNIFRNNWGGGWVLFIEDSNRTSALLSQNAYENNTGNVVYGSSEETPSIYRITLSLNSLCLNEPCLTISEFIDQAGQYIALNTTLMFLPGTHTVRSGLLVEGVASLTLLGDSSGESLPLIKCDRPASLGFKHIDELVVRSLAFDSCGDGTYAAFNVKSVSSVEISNGSFKNSINSGGAVVVANCDMLLITETVFENNSAIVGGGLYVSESVVKFIGNNFTNNKAEFGGAGILLLHCSDVYAAMTTFKNNSVLGTEIVNNDHEFRGDFLPHVDAVRFSGGAMLLLNSNINFSGYISIDNSNAEYGGGVMALESNLTFSGTVRMQDNTATYGGGVCVIESVISFSGLTDFCNNHAKDSGGAVYAIESCELYFEGNVSFEYNKAAKGGGLYLAHRSLCNLSATALQIYFVQNHASKNGGAIYVDDSNPSVYCEKSSLLKSLCFFQVQSDREVNSQAQLQARIHFSNNTAKLGGGDLYGGTIDNCKLPNIDICSYCVFKSSQDVFDTMATTDLDITSVPLKVCSCEQQISDCPQSYFIYVYPGKASNVPVTVIGQRNGIVSTSIQSQTSGNITIRELEKSQSSTISQQCSNFFFTVFTSAESQQGSLMLYTDGPCSRDQNSFVIQVQMLPCPHGFHLSNTTIGMACDCDERLKKRFTESCNITTGTIFRPSGSTFWVGHYNDSRGLILHPHCPFDYCTEEEMNVDVDSSDTQCNNNRSGVLCGECGYNLSLALGNSRCLECSNDYLALLLVFAIAGIILVLFLFALKLTVSVGTINGLIFYANVVQVNSAIFIPPGPTNPLTLFIAWLNLDLGIEMCFFDGMDAYGKTWLQFVFPIYVWALVVIIIAVSHYSSGKIARLFGRNPIAVLATLFLLSYAKLLRTIIAAFAVTYVEYQDNKSEAVWLYDGNIRYLSGKHVPLFIVAFVFLLLLFLPYTLLLLLSQWLQAMPKVFFFINNHRMKAFLDAYHAPYNGKHRYWTGLLLCIRCILFLAIVFSALGDVSVNLLSILSAVIGLLSLKALVLGGVYKNWHVDALETSFLLNLCILAAATYHVKYSLKGPNQLQAQADVTYTLLSITFVTFVGILIYHISLQIRGTALGERISTEINRLSSTIIGQHGHESEIIELADSDTTPLNTKAATYSTLDLSIRDSVVEIM